MRVWTSSFVRGVQDLLELIRRKREGGWGGWGGGESRSRAPNSSYIRQLGASQVIFCTKLED